MAELTLEQAENIVADDAQREQARRELPGLQAEAAAADKQLEAQRILDRAEPQFNAARPRYEEARREAEAALSELAAAFNQAVRVFRRLAEVDSEMTQRAGDVTTAQWMIRYPEGTPPGAEEARWAGAANQMLLDEGVTGIGPQSDISEAFITLLRNRVEIRRKLVPPPTARVNVVQKDGGEVWE